MALVSLESLWSGALGWQRPFVLDIKFHSNISHLCQGNLQSSLPTAQGRGRLWHLKEKWTRCWGKGPWIWIWILNLVTTADFPLFKRRKGGLPVQGTLFWSFYSYPCLYQSVLSSDGVSLQERIWLLCFLNDWLVIAELVPYLLEHYKLFLQFSKDLGIVITSEKLDLEPTSKTQYLGMVIDTISERVYSTNSQITRFWDAADKFLHPTYLPAKMWQQNLGHMASLQWFVPRVRAKMCSLKPHWTASIGGPAMTVYFSEERWLCVRWWLQEERWTSGISTKCPFHLYC